jgi:hypothetical protein
VETRIKGSGLISTGLVVRGTTLIFGTSNRNLVGWDLAAGKEAFNTILKAIPARIGTVGTDRIAWAGEKGRLSLIDAGGHLFWEATVGEDIVSGPKDLGNLLMTGTSDGRLVTIDPQSGVVLSRKPGGGQLAPILVSSTRRILNALEGTDRRTVLCDLDPMSGQEGAREELPFAAVTLFDLGSSAGVALRGGEFLQLEAGTYRPAWGYRPPDGRVVLAVADETMIVVVSQQGTLATFPRPRP